METHDIAQQTLFENGLLNHLTEGLRATLGWEVRGKDLTRKLSTLRFISQCFRRHMERMMALEESDGYMDVVTQKNPRVARAVDALRAEHDYFRTTIPQIVQRLEQVSPTDMDTFAGICGDLFGVLERVEKHSKKETNLLQETVDWDSGGEG